jgi:predicted AAA+ superfamily ATPase
MITRFITDQLFDDLKPNHVTALFGARRTGKTWLMNQIINRLNKEETMLVQGDDLDMVDLFSSQRLSVLKSAVKGYSWLFIDEAQKIPNIGNSLKLIVDTIPNLAVFITGSSALDLSEKKAEPLTGRSNYFYLYPFTQSELSESVIEANQLLSDKMVYGLYPQVYLAKSQQEKQDILMSIRNGYLLKDILSLDNRKDTVFILNLLRLISFQVGNDLSYNELASSLNVNKKTVQRYLDILEKAYILFPLPGFSRNLRNEISKTPRYFFWDNGIRNIIINNLNPINQRDDVGKLWENYCISERMKMNSYLRYSVSSYFWRTYDQKEIDYVEEKNGKINAFELKYTKGTAKEPRIFMETYQNSSFNVVNRDNYLDFIADK